MTAGVVRLQTKRDRLEAEQAEGLRQAILSFPGLPEGPVGELIATLDRQTATASAWSFVMLSPAQNRAVVKWLGENSKRPIVAMQLWSELFTNLRRDTGEVMLRRDELADAVGDTPEHVSAIMTELESIGAISRKRTKVPGMKGPGVVRYFMNPSVGTHLTGAARDRAQAEAPLLRLVESPR